MNLQSESLVQLTEACKRIPGQPHIATIHRWRLHGIRGVRLETLKIGGKRFTSYEAIQRFIDATQDGASVRPARSSTAAATRQRIVDRELDAAGL